MDLNYIEKELTEITTSLVEPDSPTGTLFNLITIYRWEFYFDSGKNLDLKYFERLGE